MKQAEFQAIQKALNDVKINLTLTDGTTFLKRVPTTEIERLCIRLALKEQFGDILGDPKLDSLEKQFRKKSLQIQREQQEKKRKEEEKWRSEYNKPINVFVRLLRSGYHRIDVSHIEELTNQLTHKQLEQLFKEYKERMKKNGLPLSNEAIDWGFQFLFSLLNKTEPQKENRNLWQKLKLKK